MNRRPTLLAAAAMTAAAVLSLSACGGGDGGAKDKDTDKIAGADSDSGGKKESPSPKASEDGIDRPEIKLPKDVDNVFEGGKTGDPKKDAVLADHERMLDSIDEAITVHAKEHPALKFYSKGDALLSAGRYVESFYKANTTWVGETRYFNREVTLLKGGAAAVTYCGDDTKAYSKDRKTGKVDRSGDSDDSNDFTFYNTRMEKDSKGVWQAAQIISDERSAKCQR
ncbi:hypothetical protein [Streptomyces formicae]|uniref:Lipoprotein n=1 Tax=Streptomyces formicae TaxID=1616117 RepID=A0A291QAW0_9ACTN|nr:hypothetical protein [Streptomyces formicae]ATL28841.1 hypothetical protein KY5_3823 [Streptomyces formicae]